MDTRTYTRWAFGVLAALMAGLTLMGPPPALAQSGAISGIVFADANGNGAYDPGEQGIGGVGITFSGVGNPVTGATNADGSFLFTANVGAWTVAVTPPAGFEVVNGARQSLTVAAEGQNIVINFGLRPVQVQATNTAPPGVPTGTPGVLPTTGAPVNGGLLALIVLAAILIVGILLVLTASRPERR